MRVIAHRGYSAEFPENTLLAFEGAIAAGTDLVETDVRLTRDGHAVCWHDPDLRRVAGDTRAIGELTMPEFTAVSRQAGQVPLELRILLSRLRGRVKVMLDVKNAADALLDVIATALETTRMTGEVVYGVRDPAQYPALERQMPDVKALAMPQDPDALGGHIHPTAIAVRLWEEEVTAERIERIHAAGREAWVTAGLRARGEPPGHITAERLVWLGELGADAVLVNDPVQALRVRAISGAIKGANT